MLTCRLCILVAEVFPAFSEAPGSSSSSVDLRVPGPLSVATTFQHAEKAAPAQHCLACAHPSARMSGYLLLHQLELDPRQQLRFRAQHRHAGCLVGRGWGMCVSSGVGPRGHISEDEDEVACSWALRPVPWCPTCCPPLQSRAVAGAPLGSLVTIPQPSLSWVQMELGVPDAFLWAWKGCSYLEEGVFVSEHTNLSPVPWQSKQWPRSWHLEGLGPENSSWGSLAREVVGPPPLTRGNCSFSACLL